MANKKFTDNQIISELRDVAKKYEGKHLDTFETDINAMATDAANHIEILAEELKQDKQEVAKQIFEQAFDYSTLADWYISSVDDRDTPVWTDEHIEELLNDFYVIPKEIADGYKM